MSLIAQTVQSQGEEQVLMIVLHADGISPTKVDSPQEGPSFSGAGRDLAPAPRPLEPPHLFPGLDEEEFKGQSPAVIDTITQARAPSSRQLYALNWHLFTTWFAL